MALNETVCGWIELMNRKCFLRVYTYLHEWLTIENWKIFFIINFEKICGWLRCCDYVNSVQLRIRIYASLCLQSNAEQWDLKCCCSQLAGHLSILCNASERAALSQIVYIIGAIMVLLMWAAGSSLFYSFSCTVNNNIQNISDGSTQKRNLDHINPIRLRVDSSNCHRFTKWH